MTDMKTSVRERRIITGTDCSLARRPTMKLTAIGAKMMLNPMSMLAKGEYSGKKDMKKRVANVRAPQDVQRITCNAVNIEVLLIFIRIHSEWIEILESTNCDAVVNNLNQISHVRTDKGVILPFRIYCVEDVYLVWISDGDIS